MERWFLVDSIVEYLNHLPSNPSPNHTKHDDNPMHNIVEHHDTYMIIHDGVIYGVYTCLDSALGDRDLLERVYWCYTTWTALRRLI